MKASSAAFRASRNLGDPRHQPRTLTRVLVSSPARSRSWFLRSFVLAAAFVATIVLLPAPLYAQGGPPLVTDDPGTPGPGNWEVNLALTLDRRSSSSRVGTPLIDANYGWGERLQLKLEIPWVVVAGEPGGARNGLGNPLLGVKWRFLDEATSGIAVSTYPQFGFNLLRSTADRGLSEQETSFLLPVSAMKTLGPLEINIEIGRLFQGGSSGSWVGGLALGHVFGTVEALAEMFATGGSLPEDRQVLLNVGARVPLGESSSLLVSGG